MDAEIEQIEETNSDHHGKKVQLNVDLPEQTRDLARAMAAERGVPLGALIAALIEREQSIREVFSAMRTDPIRTLSALAAGAGAAADAGDRATCIDAMMMLAWNPIVYNGLETAEVTQVLMPLGNLVDTPDDKLFEAAKTVRMMMGRMVLRSQQIEETRPR